MRVRMFVRTLLAWAALSSACLAGNISYQKLDISVRLDASFRSERVEEWVIGAENQAGVLQIGQFPLLYVQDMQELEILSASTVMPDGTEVPVDLEKNVFDRSPAVAAGASTFSEVRVKYVVFPGLRPGGKIHLKYTWREKEALVPGYFSQSVLFPRNQAFADASVHLEVPADLSIAIKSIDMPAPQMRQDKGMKIYNWRYAAPALPERPATPDISPLDTDPRLLFSTYRDWAQLAQQYRLRADDKIVVDAAIQNLADELTRGVTDRREQAWKLYDWVNQNIRYVAIHVGAGRIVPHAAPEVLQNRYGDCKDQVVLLQALLKAKGIPASAALVNGDSAYTMQAVPVLAQLNHAVVYVPEFDLFLDSTPPFAAFGELSFQLGGKPALLVSDGTLKTIPAHNSATAAVVFDARLKFDSEGNADVDATRVATGDEALQTRATFAVMSKAELARNALMRTKLTGKIEYASDDTAQRVSPFKSSWSGRLEKLVDADSAFFVVPLLPGASDFDSFPRNVNANLGKRINWRCDGNRQEARYVFAFPANFVVAEVPKDVDVQAGEVRYTARYALESNVVTVVRVLERMQASNACTPQQAEAWLPVARAMTKDLRQAILFKR